MGSLNTRNSLNVASVKPLSNTRSILQKRGKKQPKRKVLQECITQLNGDAFNDSIGDEKQSGSSAIGSELAKLASAKKRKHTARRTDTVGTAVVAMSKDTKAQNKTQKYAFIIDSKKTIIDAIAECRKEKRKALVQEAEDRGCSLFEMKKGFDDYKKWIENSKY